MCKLQSKLGRGRCEAGGRERGHLAPAPALGAPWALGLGRRLEAAEAAAQRAQRERELDLARRIRAASQAARRAGQLREVRSSRAPWFAAQCELCSGKCWSTSNAGCCWEC